MKVTPFFVLFFFFSCSSLERIDIYRLGPLKLIRHNIEHAGDGHVVRECLDSYLFEIPLEYDTQKVHKNTKHFGDIKRIVEATYKGKIIYSKALSSANLPIKIHLKDLPIAPKDSSIDIEVYVLKKFSLIEWPKQVFYTARTYSLGVASLDIVGLGAREWDYAQTLKPYDRKQRIWVNDKCWDDYTMCCTVQDRIQITIESRHGIEVSNFGKATLLTKFNLAFDKQLNDTAFYEVNDTMDVVGLTDEEKSKWMPSKLYLKDLPVFRYTIHGGEKGMCRAPGMLHEKMPGFTYYYQIFDLKKDSLIKIDTTWFLNSLYFPKLGCSWDASENCE